MLMVNLILVNDDNNDNLDGDNDDGDYDYDDNVNGVDNKPHTE